MKRFGKYLLWTLVILLLEDILVVIVLDVVTETLHQVGAVGIIFCAELQQPQGIYAVFQRWRRGGLNGEQRQIRLRGLDFALFQIIGNDVEDDRYGKQ